MKRASALVAAAACLTLVLGAGSGNSASRDQPLRDRGRGHWFEHACTQAAAGSRRLQRADRVRLLRSPPARLAAERRLRAGSVPHGVQPAAGDRHAAKTIAIVDAYDDPNIASDLAAFDTSTACRTSPRTAAERRWFRKVNQSGGTSSPPRNRGWGLEIALDVETAHEICQNCNILLVEANSNSFANLGTAENEAVALGANVVSNSWGGGESSSDTTYDSLYFNHPGVVITASTGDSGYGVEYPAASQNVVGVGGTTLNLGAATPTPASGPGSTLARAAPHTSRSRAGRRTPVARTRPSPTSRPTPTRTPARPSTTRTGTAAGFRSAAPRSPRP